MITICLVFACGRLVNAQVPIKLPPVTPPMAMASPTLPEPIYWRQHLFLIPYQWNSATQAGAARAVSLFVSKDRGASWHKISDARPDVRSFNYRAEADGEYWFAVRTLDQFNRWLPEGPYQAELRVIVDTTIPRIEELRAAASADGAINVTCRVTDVNLDPLSLAVEAQTDAAAPWLPVALDGINSPQIGLIQTRFLPTTAVRPSAIRVRISDRAGNTAMYQATGGAGGAAGPVFSQPSSGTASVNPFDAAGTSRAAVGSAVHQTTPSAAAQPTLGWYSHAAQIAQPTAPVAPQQWPASVTTQAPFRLWTAGPSPRDDSVTAFGSPQVSSLPIAGNVASSTAKVAATTPSDSRIPAQYASTARTDETPSTSGWTSGVAGPQITSLEPFRESLAATSIPAAPSVTPIGLPSAGRLPTATPKLVGSRTFALEYDLDGSPNGISRVELWGTRDRGQSWSRYAIDNDNRSPLVVTVDDEGLYGFKILVQNAGDLAPTMPRTGEEPELWVAVDLKRPIVELTAIERGEANLADHLVLHWRAQDDNLEPRPISLYFSSRPGGPWSAIATNLEDSGQYAWRVERYVPSKIYLRIEARDTAGNLAAFQTREPVEYVPAQPTGRLRSDR